MITQAAVIIMRKLEAANQGGFYESHRPTKERERELEREQGRSCNYGKVTIPTKENRRKWNYVHFKRYSSKCQWKKLGGRGSALTVTSTGLLSHIISNTDLKDLYRPQRVCSPTLAPFQILFSGTFSSTLARRDCQKPYNLVYHFASLAPFLQFTLKDWLKKKNQVGIKHLIFTS